jgi:MinD superfamily P-loop ATPase
MIKIAVASGKGGTGKTFVATNIFYSLIKDDTNAVLVDCDAEAPNAAAFFDKKFLSIEDVCQQIPEIDETKCTYCGKCHDWCNYNAIFIIPPSKIIKVIEDLCHGCGACFAACEFNAIKEKNVSLGEVSTFLVYQKFNVIEARMKVGVMSPVKLIKAALKKIEPEHEIAILDSPPGTSCPFIQTTAQADFVILVTEPTPFGLSDLKQSVETLKQMKRQYGVIINRAGIGNRDVYSYLNEEKIPLLMEIPYDAQIASLYSKGKIVAAEMPDLKIKFKNLIKNIINYLKTNEYANSKN